MLQQLMNVVKQPGLTPQLAEPAGNNFQHAQQKGQVTQFPMFTPSIQALVGGPAGLDTKSG
jgi:hypothetical protein